MPKYADDPFDRPSFIGRLTAPLRKTVRWIASFGSDGESFGRSSSDESIWRSLLLFPVRILGAFGQFLIFGWSTSRNGSAFVRAIPVVGAVLLVIAIKAIAVWRLEASLTPAYLGRFEYYSTRDATFARNCAERLVSLKPIPENLYWLGVGRFLEDNFVGALNVMKYIAPDDQPGYAKAHVWIGNQALANLKWILTPDERRAIATQHFTQAFELEKAENNPEGIEATIKLAELEIQKKDFERAAQILENIITKEIRSGAHLQAISRLLMVYRELNRLEQVIAAANSIEPKLYQIAMEFPDLIEPWQALVDISSQAEKFDQAESYLRDAFSMAKDQKTQASLGKLRSRLYLRRALMIKDLTVRENYLNRFVYLARAIAIEPTNEEAYRMMLDYVDLEAENPDEEELIRFAVGLSQVPAVVHTILGLRDAQRGDWSAARNHFDIAGTQSEQVPWVAGMFLMISLKTKTLPTTQLITIVEYCLTIYPAQPMLSMVLGSCLSSENRHDEAVATLKTAVEANPKWPNVRDIYAQVLEAAGRKQEADAEREQVKVLLAALQKELEQNPLDAPANSNSKQ